MGTGAGDRASLRSPRGDQPYRSQTPGLQSSEGISLCRFKPPHLWQFVPEAPGNESGGVAIFRSSCLFLSGLTDCVCTVCATPSCHLLYPPLPPSRRLPRPSGLPHWLPFSESRGRRGGWPERFQQPPRVPMRLLWWPGHQRGRRGDGQKILLRLTPIMCGSEEPVFAKG